jgi:hypothetical protein
MAREEASHQRWFLEQKEAGDQDDKTLGGLDKILQEETAHVKRLTEMLQAVEAQSIPEETLSLQP